MGAKQSTTTQTNEPPKWARPLLEKSAAEAQRLYDSKSGYNVYTGPTQAPLSPQTLGAMNSIMARTGGGGGPPITNQSINSLIPDISQLIQQVQSKQSVPTNPKPINSLSQLIQQVQSKQSVPTNPKPKPKTHGH